MIRPRANFGEVAAHPEAGSISILVTGAHRVHRPPKKERTREVEGRSIITRLGRTQGRKPAPRARPDWIATANAVAYNADLDQVLLNVSRIQRILDHRP